MVWWDDIPLKRQQCYMLCCLFFIFNIFLYVHFYRSEIIKIDRSGWCFENVDWQSHECNYERLDSKVIQFYTMRCIQIIILPCIYVAHDNTFFARYERDGDRLRWCSKRILRQGAWSISLEGANSSPSFIQQHKLSPLLKS